MTELELDPKLRQALATSIKAYLDDEFEIEIGNMDADLLIGFLINSLGAHFYNAGLRDAAKVVARRGEEIADDLYAMEKVEVSGA